MSEYTDDELVGLYSNGDNRAFDELLSRTQELVFVYIQSVVHNEDMANDLFQETFVKAIVKIQSGHYDGRGRLSGWLIRIAHNIIIDNLRRDKSSLSMFTNVEDGMDNEALSRLLDFGVENLYVRRQILKDVRRLKDNLPPEQREVVEMRFYKKMSFREIASATNVSISTALGRMRYALRNMRRMSKEYDILQP